MFALCVAEHYRDVQEFAVDTSGGGSRVEICDGARGVVRVEMGVPSFDAADVPVRGLSGPAIAWPLMLEGRSVTVTSVNVGNPHTVVALEEISAELAHELGPKIARHPRFPDGSNVELLRVIDRATIELEIWERGAGYTLASGSSTCAAASAAPALDLVAARVL